MGVFRGWYQLGDSFQIGVQCVNGSRTPSAPDAAPSYRIYHESGTLIQSGQLPPIERTIATGLFEKLLFVGSTFSSQGRYYIRYSYAVSSTQYVDVDSFLLNISGSTTGMINSMTYLDRPDADWLVCQTDAGSTPLNRGPHV